MRKAIYKFGEFHEYDDANGDEDDKECTSNIDTDQIFKSARLTHKNSPISPGEILTKNDRPRDDCTLYVCNSASIIINKHQSV